MIKIDKNSIFYDNENSLLTNLEANQIFLGVSKSTSNFVKIIITIQSNVPSAANGLKVEFSNDELIWNEELKTINLDPLSGIYGGIFSYVIKGCYYKVSYTNGPNNQSYFSLQSVLKRFSDEEQITAPVNVVKESQPSTAVRIVSDFKKDVAMGLIEYNKNFNVNGARYNVGNVETILTNISGTTYQWPTSAQRLRIKSGGNSNDSITGSGAKAIQINGLDSNYDQISEVVYTAGINSSSWTTKTFIRVNSVLTVASGNTRTNEGAIIIENEIDNYEISVISPKFGRALSCVYTTPRGYSCVISRVLFMTSSNASITLKGYFREFSTNTDYIINYMPGFSGVTESTQQNYIKFNPKTDFWATAQKIIGDDDADASIIYELDLLKLE